MSQQQNIKKWDKYDSLGIGVGSYTDDKLLNTYVKGRILDMGCGRGKMLASVRGAQEKFGLDLSQTAIDEAVRNYPGNHFAVGDVTQTPYADNFFDFIYSLEVIEHIEQPEKMLLEIKRILKPGGYALVQTPNYPTKRLYDFFLLASRSKKRFKR
jgi:2-polyprenyl-3-methyl-5-hydroxy-6-metoxy-1,4-benzoquinol methylase